MQSGRTAMWYDSTVAAQILEANGFENLGVALSPTGPSGMASGWIWTWALAIPEGTENTAAAWEFISWATSEEFINTVGENDGWAALPPGVRTSTYENPSYLAATESYGDIVFEQINSVDPLNPGTTPRPGLPARSSWASLSSTTSATPAPPKSPERSTPYSRSTQRSKPANP